MTSAIPPAQEPKKNKKSKATNPLLVQAQAVFGETAEEFPRAINRAGRGIRAYLSPVTQGQRAGLVKLEAVRVRPDGQVRTQDPTEDPSFAELVASVETNGVMQPVSLSWDETESCFWIDAGHRRVQAARAAGVDAIPAIVICDGEEPKSRTAKLTERQLIENLQREDLPTLDIANGLKALLETGVSAAEIGRRIGKSRSWVGKHLKVMTLPKDVLVEAEEKKLGHEVLYTLAQANIDDGERRELLNVAAEEGRNVLQRRLDEKKVERAPKRKVSSKSSKKIERNVSSERAILGAIRRAEKDISHLLSLLELDDGNKRSQSLIPRARNLLSALEKYAAKTAT